MNRFRMGSWNYSTFPGSVQAGAVWAEGLIGRHAVTHLLPTPPPTPACTLPAFIGNVLRTSASQRQCGFGQSCACSVISSSPSRHMDLFSREGDTFALLAVLSGSRCDVSERNWGCVVCAMKQDRTNYPGLINVWGVLELKVIKRANAICTSVYHNSSSKLNL